MRLTGFCWSLFKRCLPLRPTRQQRPLLAPMNGRRRQRWPIREMCRLLRPMRERHLQLRPIRKRCRLLGTLRERRWKLRPIRGRCEFLRPVRQRRRYYWSIRNRRRWMTSMRARRRQRPPPQSTLSTARDIPETAPPIRSRHGCRRSGSSIFLRTVPRSIIKRVVPPKGSSERSTEECSVDTGRPRAIQGLDVREAKYLRQAASRVRKLWSKANAETWAEEVCPSVGE